MSEKTAREWIKYIDRLRERKRLCFEAGEKHAAHRNQKNAEFSIVEAYPVLVAEIRRLENRVRELEAEKPRIGDALYAYLTAIESRDIGAETKAFWALKDLLASAPAAQQEES